MTKVARIFLPKDLNITSSYTLHDNVNKNKGIGRFVSCNHTY